MLQLIDLSIPEKAEDLQHLVKIEDISCGLDLVSMAGEWLTATANTN
ncbi:unnamed protein product, partial [Strongylus vulgaris]